MGGRGGLANLNEQPITIYPYGPEINETDLMSKILMRVKVAGLGLKWEQKFKESSLQTSLPDLE